VDPLPGDVRQQQAASWSAGMTRARPSGPQSRPSTLVYLARHGQTESNLLGRYAGYSAESINELGRTQMQGLAARLEGCGIAEIWTSDVPRARESAELVARLLGVPLRSDERLNEMRLGPWEGLTEAEVARDFPGAYSLWCTVPDRLTLDGRETLHAVAERIASAVSDAVREPRPVLLMSHVAPIRVAVLAALAVPLSQYKRLHMGNGDGVVIDRTNAEARRLGEDRSLQHELPVTGADSALA